jgi:hypothetical protein
MEKYADNATYVMRENAHIILKNAKHCFEILFENISIVEPSNISIILLKKLKKN